MRKRFSLNDRRLSPQTGRRREEASRSRFFVLLNAHCPCSFQLQSLLDCERAGNISSGDDLKKLQYLKIIQVLQILKSSGIQRLVQDADAGEDSAVCKLPETALSALYDKLLKGQEEASQIQGVENAKEHGRRKLEEAWNDKITAGQVTIKWKEPVVELTAARLLPLDFTILCTEPRWWPCPDEVPDTREIPGPVQARFSRSTAEDAIKCALHSSPFRSSETVRILVAGGNGTLHNMLLGYMNLVTGGVLAGGRGSSALLDVLFFILPTGASNNSLATYIAQRDLWYDANVYRPVKSRLPLVPHVGQRDSKPVDDDDLKKNKSEALPGLMLTRQIENFVLEARCALKITVFDFQGWFTDNHGNKFVCCIPFCCRAEIGIPGAAASSEQKKVKHYQCIPRSTRDHSSGNIFEQWSSPLKLRLVYRPVDWNGSEKEERDVVMSIGTLVAVNVPKDSENRLACNPCDDLLNLCLWAPESARRKSFASASSLRLQDCREELLTQASTVKCRKILVQTADSSRSFDVSLDGENYGPFYRVRLLPSVHPVGNGVKFSVATYLPTEVSRHAS